MAARGRKVALFVEDRAASQPGRRAMRHHNVEEERPIPAEHAAGGR